MPDCSFNVVMVNGNVAADELVENAISNTPRMARKCCQGLTLTAYKINDKVSKLWIAKAKTTVTTNHAKCIKMPKPVWLMVVATKPNTPNGAKRIISMVIITIISCVDCQKAIWL